MKHLNPFRNIFPILPGEQLVDIAFKRSAKVSTSQSKRIPLIIRARKLAYAKLNTAYEIVINRLTKVVKEYPSFDNIHPFYREMADILFDVNKIRKALGSISGAIEVMKKLKKQYSRRILFAKQVNEVINYRRAAFGRLASLVSDINDRLIFLENVRRTLSKLPDADPNLKTITVAGAPNVGKSTLVRQISSAKPEIAEYPFTTRNIIIGHLKLNGFMIQVIDTPGLLDRPISKRNKIELQAIAALKHLTDLIIFIFDPSDLSSIPINQQISLFLEIKNLFPRIPIISVANKKDIASKARFEELKKQINENIIFISAIKNEGISDLLKNIKQIISKRLT